MQYIDSNSSISGAMDIEADNPKGVTDVALAPGVSTGGGAIAKVGQALYTQVGDVVTLHAKFLWTPGSTNSEVVFEITAPERSANFSSADQGCGTGSCFEVEVSTNGGYVTVEAVPGSTDLRVTAELRATLTNGANTVDIGVSCSYQV